jgi:primosomal protein N' (replication factor Y) (superfamily II helicase)
MIHRRDLGYPPFQRLARVLFRYPSESKAQKEAESVAQTIRQTIRQKELTATKIIGPAPAFFQKQNDIYRWQIIVKGSDPAAALSDLRPSGSMSIDIDPLDML